MDILAASLAGALVLAVILLVALRRPASGPSGSAKRQEAKRRRGPGEAGGSGALPGRECLAPGGPGHAIQPHCCPLCSLALAPGERVKSDLSAGKGDRIMRIFGCPRCWPAMEGRPPRLCPVCGGEIPADGYAVARYFERPGRKHVHVLGCSRCRPGA